MSESRTVKKIVPISEDGYEKTMTEIVEPELKKFRKEGFITFEDGRKLHYEYYICDGATASVVISHGYTEMAEKFREMMYYFLTVGYNVFALDHRGHGFSSRIVDDPNLAHVECFDGYVTDFNIFTEKVVKPHSGDLPLYLYSHSMGGAIAVLHLQRYPGVYEKAVLSAPMIAPKTAGIPHAITKMMTTIFKLIGKGASMVFTESPFNPDRTYEDSGDTSKVRFDYTHGKRKQHIEYQTCATTYKWLDEALRIIRIMLKKENCDRITAKILLFQAENDGMVEPLPQEEFVSKVPSARLERIANSKHEIYLSVNEAMEPYLEKIFDFYAE